MSQFVMPSLGADMESAVLMEWLVKEGDSVKKGQVIAEVETSKGVIEIEVFEDGIIEKLLVEPETECKVGEAMAVIKPLDEALVSEEGVEVTAKEPQEEELHISDDTADEAPKEEKTTTTEDKHLDKGDRVKISPAARKKASEMGVDISKITPKEGVRRLDQIEIEEEVKEQKEQVKSDKNDAMRQAIAAAMSRSNAEIPHYYLSTTINMSPALHHLEELNKERSINDRVLPVALLIKAVVAALKDVPQLNGFWRDNTHIISEEINPGIAIALRKKGLITPAILNAQNMTLDDTMASMSDLITRSRSGKLRSSEMTQQTITVTNLGDLGVESVYGVIYPPQLAIVGLGAIVDAPWAEGDSLCVRKVMQATLAGDHRATDGRTGAEFLNRFKQLLENPKELL